MWVWVLQVGIFLRKHVDESFSGRAVGTKEGVAVHNPSHDHEDEEPGQDREADARQADKGGGAPSLTAPAPQLSPGRRRSLMPLSSPARRRSTLQSSEAPLQPGAAGQAAKKEANSSPIGLDNASFRQRMRRRGVKLGEFKGADPYPWFGEAALILGAPRGATAIATEATKLITLHAKFFPEFLKELPSFAEMFLTSTASYTTINKMTLGEEDSFKGDKKGRAGGTDHDGKDTRATGAGGNEAGAAGKSNGTVKIKAGALKSALSAVKGAVKLGGAARLAAP